jgi:anti-sigma regulatory factor (Ser/Thr protein kinase)
MTTALVVEKANGGGSILELVSRHDGWTAERAGSPDAALDRLGVGKFEVLLADTDLVRGRDEWLATVRERHPNLPVVLVTPQKLFHDTGVKALVLGAATFVPRDRLARDLITTVERIVALATSNGAPAVGVLAETTHRYVLANDRTSVAPVLRHVQTELDRYGVCDRPDRLRVAVALEEALINAIVHGNLEVSSRLRERGDEAFERAIAERTVVEPYRARRARFVATYRASEATFVIADEGPGFDPQAIPDPTDPDNLAKPYGRGLLLMRTFMTDVRYNAKGNEVTLVKRCAGA